MNINAKDEIRLSLSSLDDYIKTLELKQEQIIKATQNIATRLAEEAGKDTYKSVVIIPAEVQDNTAIAYAKSTNEVDTYKEFGTGIVGSQNPHIDEALTKSGGYIQKKMELLDGLKVNQLKKSFILLLKKQKSRWQV